MRLHLILTTTLKSIYIIIILCSLDTRKRKLKEEKRLAQGYSAKNWQSWDFNLGFLILKLCLFLDATLS